ncbi:MAG: hypothetical protein RL071_247 [Pseudomonadota bacterium]
MDSRDFDEIERFLTTVGKATLFEYLGLGEDAADEAVDAALQKRRSWAQGQQSNPKYRTEAIWLIKNMGLIKRVLVSERGGYLGELQQREQGRKLQILKQYILGTLAEGRLSRRDKAGVMQQARALGLAEPLAQHALDELLAQTGTQAEGEPTDVFVDHYLTLGLRPDADYNTLYSSYRQRLEQLRHTLDRQLAEEQRDALELAWRVLSDPAAREVFDQQRRLVVGDPAPRRPAGLPEPAAAGPIARAPEPAPVPEAPSAPVELRPKLALVERPAEPEVRPPLPAPQPAAADREALRPNPSLGRFSIEPAGTLALQLGKKPQVVELKVRRTGTEAAPCKLFVERAWVSVEPRTLTGPPGEHTVQITVDPSKMERDSAVAIITVLSELTGQRATLTLDVKRPAKAPVAAILMVAMALLAVVGGAAWWLSRPPPPAGPQSGVLIVEVDPAAGEISVNGEILSTNGRLRLDQDLRGQALKVGVQLDGFAPVQEAVQVQAGETVTLRPALELTDKMDFIPPREEAPAPIDEAKARAALDATAPAAAACLAQHGPGEPGSTITATATLLSTHDGWIRSMKLREPGLGRAPLQTCLRRVVRATRLPFVNGYASTTYTWTAQKAPGR